jgi:hypothetical protein
MRQYRLVALLASVLLVMLSNAPVGAQSRPTVQMVPSSNHPAAVPPGMKVTCTQGPNTGAPSPTCPVLQYLGYTFWAYSYQDNRGAMGIVAYDPAGNIAKQWEKVGARYVWKIEVNADETVTFFGQSNATIVMPWSELAQAVPPTEKLSVVNLNTRAAACVFNTNCQVTPTETSGDIPMPPGVTGTGRVHTSTFSGTAGSPGAGKTAYQYRVDLTQAVSDGEAPCVTDLTIDFGPIAKLQYDGTGPVDDIFVVDQGGPGTIGIYSAEQTVNKVYIIFNQPVCAGPTPGTGRSSFLIGLASTTAPANTVLQVGWPGLEPLPVRGRAPTH